MKLSSKYIHSLTYTVSSYKISDMEFLKSVIIIIIIIIISD